MEYNIYIDVFFFLNIIMNFLLLTGGSRLLRYPFSVKRFLISSGVGAFLNCGILVVGIRFPGMPFFVAYIMSLLFLGWKRKKEAVLFAATLFFLAFCMEGAIRWAAKSQFGKFAGHPFFTWETWAGISLVLMIAGLLGRKRRKKAQEIRVLLHFKGREKEFQGFYDSGNLLSEPITGKMVHIACYEEIKELLPENYRQVAEEYYRTGIFESTKVTKLQMYEFTFLSYHSIGKETGQLLGIRMDSAVFKSSAGEVRSEKAVIALVNQKLFVRGSGRMIINGRLEL